MNSETAKDVVMTLNKFIAADEMIIREVGTMILMMREDNDKYYELEKQYEIRIPVVGWVLKRRIARMVKTYDESVSSLSLNEKALKYHTLNTNPGEK